MMLAFIKKEKASSCKLYWTSEHLFQSHLQTHVTKRLWEMPNFCSFDFQLFFWAVLGVLLQMSEAEGPMLFQHSPHLEKVQAFSVLWKRFPVLVPEFSEWLHIPNPTAHFRVSIARVSTFLCHSGLGKCCSRLACISLWVVFFTGNKSGFSVLPMCPAWICIRLMLLFYPWSFSPSLRQSRFSLVAKPVVAGPGCEFCFRDWPALWPWANDLIFSGPLAHQHQGIKEPYLLYSSLGVKVCQVLSTMPPHNDCRYVGYLLF